MSKKFGKYLCGLVSALSLFVLNAPTLNATDSYARQDVFLKMLDAPCQKYHLPKILVMAIARQESGFHPWIVNIEGRDYYPESREKALQIATWALRNDKSFDVGLMQVNSYWIKKYRWPLLSVIEPRNNIMIGCWILAQEIQRHGYNWKAIAYYHTPLHRNWDRGVNYARSIVKHIRNIQQQMEMRSRSLAMPVPDFRQAAPIAAQVAYTRTNSGLLIRDLPGENIKATLITDRDLRKKPDSKKDPEINLKSGQPRTLETLMAERVATQKKRPARSREKSVPERYVAQTMREKMRKPETLSTNIAAAQVPEEKKASPPSEKIGNTREFVAQTMLDKMRGLEKSEPQSTAAGTKDVRLPGHPKTLRDLLDERMEHASQQLLASK